MLRARKDRSDGGSANLLIVSKAPAPDLVVETEPKDDTPLRITPATPDPNHRSALFQVAVRPDRRVAGDFNILVHRASSTDRLVVPVSVRLDEGKSDEN